MSNLKGKVVLVTGAATGIGRATVNAFADQGAAVIVNHPPANRAEAAEVLQELANKGAEAVALEADLTVDDQVHALVEQAVTRWGRLDALVNNAGWSKIMDPRDLNGVDEVTWDRAMSVNLKAGFYCSRAALPHLEASGGSIVNISSVAGFTGQGSSIPYALAKAGVVALTKGLARSFGPKVRVNAIAPWFVLSGWIEWPKEVIAKATASSPLARLPKPEDIADIAVFLVNGPSIITGQTIFADCGFYTLGPRSG
jgi:3-oxoacyl-[acyl-carrier protein] reductase